jgi:hypothetical protein
VEFATIADANHLFIVGTGKPGPAEYTTAGHVEEGVIDRLVQFVQVSARR